MFNLPSITAAYTPGIEAELIAVANPITVLFGLTGTVIVDPLIKIVFPAVKLVGAAVPEIVGHAVRTAKVGRRHDPAPPRLGRSDRPAAERRLVAEHDRAADAERAPCKAHV